MSICVRKYPLFTLKDTELLEEWTVDVLEKPKDREFFGGN